MWHHGIGVVAGQSVFWGARDACRSRSIACATCDNGGCIRGGLLDGVMVVVFVCVMR